MTDLDILIDLMCAHYKYDAASYPELAGKNEEEVRRFAFHHAVMHFAKTAGRAVGVVEQTDHGGAFDADALKVETGKMLVNTLMMAHLLGWSGEDLMQFVRNKYPEKKDEGAGV